MSKSTPSPPPQPDPRQVAAAQTGSNVTTAVANSVLGNANQYGPYGSTTFEQTGNQSIFDPSTKSTYDIPRYTQTTTLAPEQQHLLDQQNQLSGGLNDLAISQTGRIGDLLGQPIQAPSGSLQRNVNVAQAPTQFGQTANQVKYDVGPTDFSADRQRVEEGLFSRLNPQLDHERQLLDTKLANEGFTRGTPAYSQAMDEYLRQSNDARTSVLLAGGQEQSRLADLALKQGQFYNSAQSQDFDQLAARGQFAQQGTQINNSGNLAAGQFANQAYGQDLQTQLALRNQPINEISALMSGGQVNLPQFAGYQGGTVNPTPIGDYYMQNAQLANQNYQAQLQANAQQTAGLYGGLSNLAGMGLYGLTRRA